MYAADHTPSEPKNVISGPVDAAAPQIDAMPGRYGVIEILGLPPLDQLDHGNRIKGSGRIEALKSGRDGCW